MRRSFLAARAILYVLQLTLHLLFVFVGIIIHLPTNGAFKPYQVFCRFRLCHNFFYFLRSRWSESNRRPTPYHGVALPTELHRRFSLKLRNALCSSPRRRNARAKATPLLYTVSLILKTALSHFSDSNRGPFAYKAIALPTELKWHFVKTPERHSEKLVFHGFRRRMCVGRDSNPRSR